MATMAFVTVAGETLAPEWNMNVANSARVPGLISLTFVAATNDWNFFQPDSYCRQVEVRCARVISLTVGGAILSRVKAMLRNSMRVDARMS